MAQGEYIILTIDLNSYVIDSEEAEILRGVGLCEAITERHLESGLVPTHQRGQVLIDSIFLSGSLTILQGGYFPIAQAPSDHRALWIKVKVSSVFRYILQLILLFSTRRVKC